MGSRRLREEDPGQIDREQERRDLQRDEHPAELGGVGPPVERKEDRALGQQDEAPGVTGLGVRLLPARVTGPPGEVLLEDRAEDQTDQRHPGHGGADVGDREAQGVEHARQVEVLGVARHLREEDAEGHSEDTAEGVLDGVPADQPDGDEGQGHRQGRDGRGVEVLVDGEDRDEKQPGEDCLHHAAHAAEGLEEGGLGDGLHLVVLLGGVLPAGVLRGRTVGLVRFGRRLVERRHRLLLGERSEFVCGVEQHPAAMAHGDPPRGDDPAAGFDTDDGATAEPDHVQRLGAVEEPASRAGTPARGRRVTVRNVPATFTICRSEHSEIRVHPVTCASSCSSWDSRSSWELESRSSIRRKRPEGLAAFPAFPGFSDRGTALIPEGYRSFGLCTEALETTRKGDPAPVSRARSGSPCPVR